MARLKKRTWYAVINFNADKELSREPTATLCDVAEDKEEAIGSATYLYGAQVAQSGYAKRPMTLLDDDTKYYKGCVYCLGARNKSDYTYFHDCFAVFPVFSTRKPSLESLKGALAEIGEEV